MKKNLSKKQITFLLIGAITVIQVILLVLTTTIKSVGYDDCYQISINLQDSFPNIMHRLIRGDNTPPLYTLLTIPWMYIGPHTTEWLRIPNQLCVVAGTFLCGVIGYRLRGRYCALFTTFFAATSFQIIQRAGLSFRSYGLFFFTTCLCLYFYLRKLEDESNRKWFIWYTISLILMAYSHYFGVLNCIFLFCCDFLLWLLKRKKLKDSIPYFIAGASYIPWIIPFLELTKERRSEKGAFWASAPGVSEYFDQYMAFINYDKINLILYFIVGFVLIILTLYYIVKLIKKKAPTLTLDVIFLWISYVIPFVTITGIWLFANYINPNASLWGERYFVGLLPFIVLSLGIIWSYIANILLTDKSSHALKSVIFTLFLILGITISILSFQRISTFEKVVNEMPYETVVRFLEEQPDIRNDEVIAVSGNGDHTVVWEYFFSKTNQDLASKMLSHVLARDDSLAFDPYDKIYLAYNFPLCQEFTEMLDSQFTLVEEIPELRMEIYERVK